MGEIQAANEELAGSLAHLTSGENYIPFASLVSLIDWYTPATKELIYDWRICLARKRNVLCHDSTF